MKSHPFKPLAWTAFCGIITLTILLAITVAQTTEPLTTSPPSEAKKAGTIDKDSANTLNTALPDSTAIAVEMQRHFNELRRELLDDRARVVDWWLFATGIVLTFFGIVVAIVGIVGFRRFREIENEAKKSIQIVTDLEKAAKRHLEEIEKTREKSHEIAQRMNAKLVADDPDGVGQAVKNVQNNPNASLIDKAVADTVLLQRQGNREDAIEKWRAIAHIAEDADAFLAARAWFSVGYLLPKERHEEAILANDLAIRLKPDYAEAYHNRGVAKESLGQYVDAIADCDEAIRLKPNIAEAYTNRGNAKGKLGRHKEAIADYDEAIRLKPDVAEAYHNRGVAKESLARHEDAITDYDKAIRLKPDIVEAYNNRGNAKGKLGRHKEAIADYDEAIRLKPDYAEAYNNRGIDRTTLGCREQAIADYDEAIRLKPDLAEAYYNRGNAKGELGRHDEVIEDYDEAVRLKSDYTEALLKRGAYKVQFGLKNEARSDFQFALEHARNAGNADLAIVAEKLLHDLDAGDSP